MTTHTPSGYVWNNLTFCELMKNDPKKAFEYRFKSMGTPIPEEYLDEEDEEDEENEENEISEDLLQFSKHDLMEKLRNSDVKFSNAANYDVLMQKCVENNLL